MIPVNNVVKVNILSSPIFPARRGFGILLILGTSAVLNTAERSREYLDLDGVGSDFGTNSEEYKAATIFYAQSPNPRVLRVGRRYNTAVGGENVGSKLPTADIATWQAVTTGAMNVNIDGTVKSISALNFSTDTNLVAVAARIQTALVTAGAVGAKCTYSGTRFVIGSGTTGPTSSVGYTVAPGTGVYIGNMLGTDASKNPTLTVGSLAEAAPAALSAQQDYNSSWYGLHFTTTATEQDCKDAALWCEARTKIFGYTTTATAALSAASTTDLGYAMKAAGYRRTFGMYDPVDSYAAISAMARAFAVNFNSPSSALTLKFKTLPGVTPENLSGTDKSVLDAKNLNYYTYFGDSPMLAEGKMASGVFFDEVHGLDWLQNAIETNVFGYLYSRTTKVPQTDRGVQLIMQQIEKALAQGVENGLLAPGTWNGGEFGALRTGDFLKSGYYIYASSVQTQNQSDREARKAPPITCAAKGAGALHNVDVSVSFDR